MDDKTRIKARTAPVDDTSVADAPPDDKTRVLIRPTAGRKGTVSDAAARAASSAGPEESDKTRFVSRSPRQSSDATVLAPRNRKDGADRTQLRTPVSSIEEGPTQDEYSNEYGVLKNRFVFEEVLGSGGMGIVYKAKDLLKVEAKDRDPYVAIKVLSDEFRAHPEAFIALQRESRKTQRMAHPNIVNVYDFDRDGDTVYMTMEYMDGTPLDKLISQYRSVGLPTETIWQVLEGICAALIYAHAQNVIHSDFKPGNIFVTSSGNAKVFDFGIARAVAKAENREESKDDRTVFDAGSLGALTPAYASLEMLEGETPDVRDDIYALGCIAYELFTGEHPYNRMHADEAKRQKVKPKRISGIRKKQWRAIERALAFERENRIESVESFWREMTEKVSHTGKISAVIILMVGLAGGAYFQYKPADDNGFSADQFRSEIERNLRIELKKEALANLYAAADFSSAWERDLWNDVQELRQLLGAGDEWLVSQESAFYELYVQTIETSIEANQLSRGRALVENAHRYAREGHGLGGLLARIDQAMLAQKEQQRAQEQSRRAATEARQKAEQKAAEEAQKKTEFDLALANVERQLQCHTGIDMEDFRIAVIQLRAVSRQNYAMEEPKITRGLARCIEQMGTSFPERAEQAKRDAMRLFERNATIAGITIVPRDPCAASLAGAGARGRGASCSDRLPDVKDPPVMVVIPGKGSIKTFAIGQFEVSVGQINEYCVATSSCSVLEGVDASLPAHNISLTTAREYMDWLSEKSGRRYRLPTRAEWQHAANAEGSSVDSNRNCRLNSRGISKGNALVRASVGQKNTWGLVNHLGNAQEWVADRGGRYLAVGGSYETAMDDCNVQHSVAHNGNPDPLTGFRVLREVDG